MVLARGVSLEHLINFYNIGVRLIAMELVTSTIEAKDNATRAGFLTGFPFVCCVRHIERISARKVTKFGNFGDLGFKGEKGSSSIYGKFRTIFLSRPRLACVRPLICIHSAASRVTCSYWSAFHLLFFSSDFVYFRCTCILFCKLAD